MLIDGVVGPSVATSIYAELFTRNLYLLPICRPTVPLSVLLAVVTPCQPFRFCVSVLLVGFYFIIVHHLSYYQSAIYKKTKLMSNARIVKEA
jgi:hypothetical protein